MSAITISGLSKSYGDVRVIDDLSLDVAPGEFVALLGPSGCGKTTTLRAVAGLDVPDAGDIRIGDRLVTSRATGAQVPPHRRGIGLVFQSYAVWPHMSVLGNVSYPLRRAGVRGAELRERSAAALATVGLAELGHRQATQLSGGQQQRVALARALVADPAVLLFDEPLSNLDATLRVTLRDEIQRLTAERRTTALYVTHDQSEACALADRVAVMLDGRIVQLGTPREVVNDPATLDVARFLGVENLVTARVTGSDADRWVLHAPGLGGTVTARRTSRRHAVGDLVTLAVRAGAVRLTDAHGDGLRGVVEHSSFLGEEVQVRVRVGDERILARVPAAGHVDLRPGATVAVLLPADRVTTYPSPTAAPAPADNRVLVSTAPGGSHS